MNEVVSRVFSITRYMSRNLISPARKLATATSLAALTAQAIVPPSSAIREVQAGKPFGVGALESESGVVGNAEASFRRVYAGGISQSVTYRQVHVGNAELGFHRSVTKLHHGVDYALRMHHSLDALSRNAEKPPRLYYFKCFVEHSGGVDGYFVAHVPVGVVEGVGYRDILQLFGRACAERTARCGYYQPVDRFRNFAHQTLVYGGVFGVDRQY